MSSDTDRRAFLASATTGGLAVLAGCLGRFTGPSAAEGTPAVPDALDGDWPRPHADAGRSSAAPDVPGPTDPVAELWRIDTGGSPATPVVADGRLYAGTDDGTVLALDARDGTELWRASVGAPARAPSAVGDGLYVPTDEAVVALDRADGSERWRTTAPARRDTLVADHGVYWVADATAVALDLADGGERWRTDLDDPWKAHLFAAPDAVFVSSGVNGRVPWQLAPESGELVADGPENGYDFPAELFYRDGVRYGLDSFFETLQAVPLDGTTGWSTGLPPQESAAVAGGGEHVYFVGAGTEEPGLFALADADGSKQWHTDDVTSFRGRPVVTAGCVLVRGDEVLSAFDPADGSTLWRHPGDRVGWKLAVAGDVVFAADGDGVAAVRPP